MNTFDYGDLVRVAGTWTTAASVATDPTIVRFQYTDPSGNTTALLYGTDAAVVRDSTGVYHVDINVDEVGIWRYRWYSTGTGQAATESMFNIRRSHFD